MASDGSSSSSHVALLASKVQTYADAYEAGYPDATNNLLDSIINLQRAVEPPDQFVKRLRFQVRDSSIALGY